ncbi:RNA polymerase sigma factor [Aeromicrobium senzhongii]|uniref:RNA polymerase sigma factor n=1 Tax=Aeromicrobium senzhongii TaxID=2663859 RepID=A0ABX6SVS5_9ACTN|nr:sigma-70 family RNA polymerase sigma factor [Aeromicrobium senzhongii]QNL94370.1 RNA polymerase sigma factor [Aeromicrobium senzhongii]
MRRVSADSLSAALDATSADLLAYFERRVLVREDAADLLAEVMLQAWRRVDSLPQAPERRRMWLFTIAAHVLANQRRSSRRRAALADRIRQHLTEVNEPDHAEALTVQAAVRDLAVAHRELIMLVHWDGLSLAEAAELLGLNPSTARSRYSAAREALREALIEIADVARTG